MLEQGKRIIDKDLYNGIVECGWHTNETKQKFYLNIWSWPNKLCQYEEFILKSLFIFISSCNPRILDGRQYKNDI